MIPLKARHSPLAPAVLTAVLLAANGFFFILQLSSGLPDSVRDFGFVPYFFFHPFTPEVVAQQPVAVESFWGERMLALRETVIARPRPGPWAVR